MTTIRAVTGNDIEVDLTDATVTEAVDGDGNPVCIIGLPDGTAVTTRDEIKPRKNGKK